MNLNQVFTRSFNKEKTIELLKEDEIIKEEKKKKPGFVINKTKRIDALSLQNFVEKSDETYGYNELFNLIDDNTEDDDVLDHDTECILFNTYEVGKTYEDRFRNTYTIVKKDKFTISFIKNKYLYKYRQNEEKLTMTTFLEKMQFKSGEVTESLMDI